MNFETAHFYCKSLDKLLLKELTVDSGKWTVKVSTAKASKYALSEFFSQAHEAMSVAKQPAPQVAVSPPAQLSGTVALSFVGCGRDHAMNAIGIRQHF